MGKVLAFLLPVVLMAVGCGTSARVSAEDTDVNLGYSTVKQKGLTYSVSTVGVKENDATAYRDIYEYLQGRVAGVQVTPDKRIIIRGIGTNSDSFDPLILVDDVETTDLSGLNPADVQSVDVIKDGTSAIYGMRGANGVIIIRTVGSH